MRKRKTAGVLFHLVFLGPASLFFLIAVVIPFLLSIFYSLTDWNGISDTVNFVGLRNFGVILSGQYAFLKASVFTFSTALINVILVVVLGTLAALVLASDLPLRNYFRLAFYLPNVIGGMILGFIWRFIFLHGFPFIGKITGLGFLKIPWLGSARGAFWAVITVFVWQNIGYVMVVMTAGFKSVSADVLEAAVIDGAAPVQTFFKVQIPLVMPYITICLFWTIAMALKTFEICLALTQGGPYGSTTTLALGIYYDAFSNNRYGIATAEALIFFLIVVGITSLQLTITGRKELHA
jgi:raffinose/stachyose/melibiose transport system permease protein